MARSKRPQMPPQRYPISSADGKHHGQYSESGGLVTVYYNGQQKTTQVGNSPVEAIAGMLLSEMTADFRRPGRT